MSFSRRGRDSDVYTFENSAGRFECCGCDLEPKSVDFDTPEALADHLQRHIDAGYTVPGDLIPYLRAGAKDDDD